MDACEPREEAPLEQTASPEPQILPLNGLTPHAIEPTHRETPRPNVSIPQAKQAGANLFSPPKTTPEAEPPAGAEGKRANTRDIAAPPCFFSNVCHQRAAVEKAGRSACRQCAESRLRGIEYPLRASGTEPLYLTGRAASEALDMMEDISHRAKRRLRGGIWS